MCCQYLKKTQDSLSIEFFGPENPIVSDRHDQKLRFFLIGKKSIVVTSNDDGVCLLSAKPPNINFHAATRSFDQAERR